MVTHEGGAIRAMLDAEFDEVPDDVAIETSSSSDESVSVAIALWLPSLRFTARLGRGYFEYVSILTRTVLRVRS